MADMDKTLSAGHKGLSAAGLKLAAIVSMLVDHVGAGLLGRYLGSRGISVSNLGLDQLLTAADGWSRLYIIMRAVGRIAFPIFCYFLVEGFVHSSDRRKYAFRLFVFALLSEMPFDLVFRGRILEFTYQNVMFTLLAGLACMALYEKAEQGSRRLRIGAFIGVSLAGGGLTLLLHTDYALVGIVAIMILYVGRRQKFRQLLAGAVAFSWEFTAPLAFVLLAFYNGKRGLRMKYFFYAFYPVHLFLIYMICVACGLAVF